MKGHDAGVECLSLPLMTWEQEHKNQGIPGSEETWNVRFHTKDNHLPNSVFSLIGSWNEMSIRIRTKEDHNGTGLDPPIEEDRNVMHLYRGGVRGSTQARRRRMEMRL